MSITASISTSAPIDEILRFNKFQSLSCLCVECDLLKCTCTKISDSRDNQDSITCNSTIAGLSKNESIHYNHRTLLSEEKFGKDEQFEHNDNSTRTLESSINPNHKKNGINIGFLNVQGICGKE